MGKPEASPKAGGKQLLLSPLEPRSDASKNHVVVVEMGGAKPAAARTGFVPCFVPIGWGVRSLSLLYAIGLVGLTYGLSSASTLVCVLVVALLSCLYVSAVASLLLGQEHPESAAATMAEDAVMIETPTTGGEGKSAVVVGGGVSGLSTAYYLLRAGFGKVTLLEGRHKLGGNNEPYDDKATKQQHATTCVFTSPAQQPHYAQLCRELGVAQTSHELYNVEGNVVLDGKQIKVRMGIDQRKEQGEGLFGDASKQAYLFLGTALSQLSWGQLIDGLAIYALLFYEYQLQPESARSVTELLGPRLSATAVFRDFFMGWVGVNVWCRFNDLDGFPAHAFATFIFEYACPLKIRDDESGPDCCVLDGRLITALEASNLACAPRYEQRVCTEAVCVRRDEATGKKLVVARRRERADVVAERAALADLGGAKPGKPPGNPATRGADGELFVLECDVVVMATQPRCGVDLLAASSAVSTTGGQEPPPYSAEAAAALAATTGGRELGPPRVPGALPAELQKWAEMECFTFVHTDAALAAGRAWVHETLHHVTTGKPYAHYAIHPRVGDPAPKYWVSYVYGRECAREFAEERIAADKVLEVLTPTLPIFTGATTVLRNAKWRAVDAACSDIYWTHCCRSGLQFHNNGILCAKRVVRSVVGDGW